MILQGPWWTSKHVVRPCVTTSGQSSVLRIKNGEKRRLLGKRSDKNTEMTSCVLSNLEDLITKTTIFSLPRPLSPNGSYLVP